MSSVPVTNALISVSDKMGLADFGRGLEAAGVTIYSTGGTRKHLEVAGVAVRDVSSYTGFPEMMDGRLKTLHPKIFGGILCRHDREDDMQAIGEHGIEKLELVVVNLYPFEATIARDGVTMSEAIEQIDIGGPSLVRAAAKNHAFTTIATSPEQYAEILEQISNNGGTSLELRKQMAGAAFAHTAQYDRVIADYFANEGTPEPLPETIQPSLQRKAILRYGENPHQRAAVYSVGGDAGASLVSARQLNGKELSYNNLLDLDSALAIARSLPDCAVSVVKHNNPCGAASALSLAEAASKAMAGDPVSAFGSVIGVNTVLDVATAEVLASPGNFIEAIVAPSFTPEAIELLTTRPKWKANVRLMQVGDLETPAAWQYRWIEGGMLVQNTDVEEDLQSDWTIPTETKPTPEQMAELQFAWSVCRHVKSNAIVLCRDRSLVGAGAGQMSRVDSVDISIRKADDRVAGSVLASDAFFPFDDSIHKAAEAGVIALIQPGGSRRDEEVIAACNQHSLPMVFTGRRHFKH
jgi:phosphoribosylaminoimidazolecarboxamide formyltransferase/IMP cyclohydrolase